MNNKERNAKEVQTMVNRFMLNETSYHGAGAIQEILTEVKARGFKKALIVTADPDEKVVRASNNIQNVKTTFVGSLNVVDILNCDKFIISQDAVKRVEEVYAE